jgi:hypothetical protein
MDFATIVATFNRSQVQKTFIHPSKRRRINQSAKGDGRGATKTLQ